MSDAREPDGSEEPERPDGPWWTGEDEVGGVGFARFFAYTGLLMGIASLIIAVAAPLEGDALRTVWITGFATASMWIAFMAAPRYRREGMRVSPAVPITMALGVLTIVIMVYAFVVIALAANGIVLPAPAHWFGGSTAPSGVTV
ncbi:hypothetical protein [Agromyces cerinus]|uniref:Uncharacterized protein n=1 Tax=Agromyces cerinus subsp. cerinus TaxID=232089 RepID=A0A1N6F174_9MICO|nr:hypothetical protein [Agromyces cerinus]SIN88989.1 hypothetical protein SAMN05443544_1643 [Agromyces cerinus subsp. cerinus]